MSCVWICFLCMRELGINIRGCRCCFYWCCGCHRRCCCRHCCCRCRRLLILVSCCIYFRWRYKTSVDSCQFASSRESIHIKGLYNYRYQILEVSKLEVSSFWKIRCFHMLWIPYLEVSVFRGLHIERSPCLEVSNPQKPLGLRRIDWSSQIHILTIQNSQ